MRNRRELLEVMNDGTKFFIFLVVIAGVVVTFVSPLNERFAGLFPGEPDKKEQQLVGPVSGFNPRVKEIQQMLADLNLYEGVVEGKMGPQTRKALQAFQEKYNIAATGRVDSRTWMELRKQTVALIKDGNGSAVRNKSKEEREVSYDPRKIQALLKETGFYEGAVDGKVGPLTIKAIQQFQRSKNFKETGAMNHKTWKELQKHENRRKRDD